MYNFQLTTTNRFCNKLRQYRTLQRGLNKSFPLYIFIYFTIEELQLEARIKNLGYYFFMYEMSKVQTPKPRLRYAFEKSDWTNIKR